MPSPVRKKRRIRNSGFERNRTRIPEGFERRAEVLRPGKIRQGIDYRKDYAVAAQRAGAAAPEAKKSHGYHPYSCFQIQAGRRDFYAFFRALRHVRIRFYRSV